MGISVGAGAGVDQLSETNPACPISAPTHLWGIPHCLPTKRSLQIDQTTLRWPCTEYLSQKNIGTQLGAESKKSLDQWLQKTQSHLNDLLLKLDQTSPDYQRHVMQLARHLIEHCGVPTLLFEHGIKTPIELDFSLTSKQRKNPAGCLLGYSFQALSAALIHEACLRSETSPEHLAASDLDKISQILARNIYGFLVPKPALETWRTRQQPDHAATDTEESLTLLCQEASLGIWLNTCCADLKLHQQALFKQSTLIPQGLDIKAPPSEYDKCKLWLKQGGQLTDTALRQWILPHVIRSMQSSLTEAAWQTMVHHDPKLAQFVYFDHGKNPQHSHHAISLWQAAPHPACIDYRRLAYQNPHLEENLSQSTPASTANTSHALGHPNVPFHLLCPNVCVACDPQHRTVYVHGYPLLSDVLTQALAPSTLTAIPTMLTQHPLFVMQYILSTRRNLQEAYRDFKSIRALHNGTPEDLPASPQSTFHTMMNVYLSGFFFSLLSSAGLMSGGTLLASCGVSLLMKSMLHEVKSLMQIHKIRTDEDLAQQMQTRLSELAQPAHPDHPHPLHTFLANYAQPESPTTVTTPLNGIDNHPHFNSLEAYLTHHFEQLYEHSPPEEKTALAAAHTQHFMHFFNELIQECQKNNQQLSCQALVMTASTFEDMLGVGFAKHFMQEIARRIQRGQLSLVGRLADDYLNGSLEERLHRSLSEVTTPTVADRAATTVQALQSAAQASGSTLALASTPLQPLCRIPEVIKIGQERIISALLPPIKSTMGYLGLSDLHMMEAITEPFVQAIRHTQQLLCPPTTEEMLDVYIQLAYECKTHQRWHESESHFERAISALKERTPTRDKAQLIMLQLEQALVRSVMDSAAQEKAVQSACDVHDQFSQQSFSLADALKIQLLRGQILRNTGRTDLAIATLESNWLHITNTLQQTRQQIKQQQTHISEEETLSLSITPPTTENTPTTTDEHRESAPSDNVNMLMTQGCMALSALLLASMQHNATQPTPRHADVMTEHIGRLHNTLLAGLVQDIAGNRETIGVLLGHMHHCAIQQNQPQEADTLKILWQFIAQNDIQAVQQLFKKEQCHQKTYDTTTEQPLPAHASHAVTMIYRALQAARILNQCLMVEKKLADPLLSEDEVDQITQQLDLFTQQSQRIGESGLLLRTQQSLLRAILRPWQQSIDELGLAEATADDPTTALSNCFSDAVDIIKIVVQQENTLPTNDVFIKMFRLLQETATQFKHTHTAATLAALCDALAPPNLSQREQLMILADHMVSVARNNEQSIESTLLPLQTLQTVLALRLQKIIDQTIEHGDFIQATEYLKILQDKKLIEHLPEYSPPLAQRAQCLDILSTAACGHPHTAIAAYHRSPPQHQQQLTQYAQSLLQQPTVTLTSPLATLLADILSKKFHPTEQHMATQTVENQTSQHTDSLSSLERCRQQRSRQARQQSLSSGLTHMAATTAHTASATSVQQLIETDAELSTQHIIQAMSKGALSAAIGLGLNALTSPVLNT